MSRNTDLRSKNGMHRAVILAAVGLLAVVLSNSQCKAQTTDAAAGAPPIDQPQLAPPSDTAPSDAALPNDAAIPNDAAALDLDASEDFDVLTSGPVHEAFADLVPLDADELLTVDREPPQPVDEVPPEVQPDDDSVWVPGYWNFDPQIEDFVWVTGVYRKPPPGRRWVPGYWTEVDDGWQRIPGFWAPIEEQTVNYLPMPPASLELGPSSPAPNDNCFWIPGRWSWPTKGYAWQAGCWATVQPNWVWVPTHYAWTPGGCIRIPGYWDYPFYNRGLLYAPIYYRRPLYLTSAYRFYPRVLWNTSRLVFNLFAHPRGRHYYYGNYYGPLNAGRGILPWYAYSRTRGYYDPLFTYYRHDWRRSPFDRSYSSWDKFQYGHYRHVHDHAAARPPRTFAEYHKRFPSHHGRGPQQGFDGRRPGRGPDSFGPGDPRIAFRADDLLRDRRTGSGGNGPGYRRVADADRDRLRQLSSQWRTLESARRTNERTLGSGAAPGGNPPARLGQSGGGSDERAPHRARGRSAGGPPGGGRLSPSAPPARNPPSASAGCR